MNPAGGRVEQDLIFRTHQFALSLFTEFEHATLTGYFHQLRFEWRSTDLILRGGLVPEFVCLTTAQESMKSFWGTRANYCNSDFVSLSSTGPAGDFRLGGYEEVSIAPLRMLTSQLLNFPNKDYRLIRFQSHLCECWSANEGKEAASSWYPDPSVSIAPLRMLISQQLCHQWLVKARLFGVFRKPLETQGWAFLDGVSQSEPCLRV
jgi:hypothetical protein